MVAKCLCYPHVVDFKYLATIIFSYIVLFKADLRYLVRAVINFYNRNKAELSTTLYLELFGAMNRNLNASSTAEALPSMDPVMAQLSLLEQLNYNSYDLLGPSSMPQTGANVPSSSVGFPKIYLKRYELNFKHYFAFSGCRKWSVLTSWNDWLFDYHKYCVIFRRSKRELPAGSIWSIDVKMTKLFLTNVKLLLLQLI